MRSRLFPTAAVVVSSVLLASAIVAFRGAQASSDIQVTDAWIRWLPAKLPSAGYMTLTNMSSVTQVLVSASSPDYGSITMHHTRKSQEMSEMMLVESIEVMPKMSVRFAQGGYHLMLMHPLHDLHPGDRVPITLRFADGRSILVSFAIRAGNENTWTQIFAK